MPNTTAADLLTQLQAKVAELESENERLKELVREQDRTHGTVTARLELHTRTFVVTAPSVDEEKVAHLLFAGAATWLQRVAFYSLQDVVGDENAMKLFKQCWEATDDSDDEPAEAP